jgi:cytidine deaminase
LDKSGYRNEILRLSKMMRDIPKPPWSLLQDKARDEEIEDHISAGNELRRVLGRNDAVALLGIGALGEYREETGAGRNSQLKAFAAIFHSLKKPEEIETLRGIYGPAFFVLAAHAPRSRRVRDLAKKIADSRFNNQVGNYLSVAERLLAIDEAEAGNPFGQNVRDSFALADVIVNASDNQSLQMQITRFVELLFGNTLHTPSPDEQGMFLARSAALRSASLARQVGAVICRKDGSIVSMGSNEVARAGGGQYWPGDAGDGRDFCLGYDSSDRMRESLLGDILERLKGAGWLASDRAALPVKDLVTQSLYEGKPPLMKGAQFTSTIDYVRAVHAEMTAIADAARYGVSVEGCEIFTTTFPCHDCAKHIVAVGIERVIYIEPYAKSLVGELFADSIIIDSDSSSSNKARIDPFVGIAPGRYGDLFALSKRKRKKPDGTVWAWRATGSTPELPDYGPSGLIRLTAEEEAFKSFQNDLQSKVLNQR